MCKIYKYNKILLNLIQDTRFKLHPQRVSASHEVHRRLGRSRKDRRCSRHFILPGHNAIKHILHSRVLRSLKLLCNHVHSLHGNTSDSFVKVGTKNDSFLCSF